MKQKKEPTEVSIDDLDVFLNDEFNHDIYEQLTGDDYKDFKGLFEPLEFFKLFYNTTGFIQKNKARPLFVASVLEKLSLSEEQLWYFLFKMNRFFDDSAKRDTSIKICCAEIQKIQDKLEAFENPEDDPVYENPYDFAKVLEHLATLNSYKEKLAYLHERRVEYQQNHAYDWDHPTFAEKCYLEISKLENLRRLEPTSQRQKAELSKHSDARLERVVLALNYLLDAAGVSESCQKSKRINFIDFVSPYSRNTIKQQLDKLHEKASENPSEYKRDMAMIRGYFADLGLTEIVKQVDRDLEFET